MGLTNGIGALTGIAAPAYVGIMTPDSSLEQWRFVFWITFCISMVRTVIFTIFASAEVQPFNDPQQKSAAPESVKLMDNVKNGKVNVISD